MSASRGATLSFSALRPETHRGEAADHVAGELRAVAVWPMAPGLRKHRLALYVDEVSGRRFNLGAMVPPVPFGTRA